MFDTERQNVSRFPLERGYSTDSRDSGGSRGGRFPPPPTRREMLQLGGVGGRGSPAGTRRVYHPATSQLCYATTPSSSNEASGSGICIISCFHFFVSMS